MTSAESRLFYNCVNTVSDMDYGYDSVTGEYTVPSVEWSTLYGRYWARYGSELERQTAIEENERHCEEYKVEWLSDYRARLAARNKERGESARRLRELKTLGVQFPVLKELLVKLRPSK